VNAVHEALAGALWECRKHVRHLRNRLVHDCPYAEKRKRIPQPAFDTTPQMERILEHIRRLARDKLGVRESGIDNRP